MKNGRILFNSIPTGYPVPGETVVYDKSQEIDPEKVALHGGFLLKTLVLSIDPFLRGQMRDKNIPSYMPPFTPGEPYVTHLGTQRGPIRLLVPSIFGFGVGRVLRSEDPDVKLNDHIYGILQHEEYHVYKKNEVVSFKILDNKYRLPWSVFVGGAGMPGKTAYYAWKLFSNAKQGETAFVTAGAGPVGSIVIQLAKRDGLKVIASAGSPEKIEFLKSIGTDIAFNYKQTKTTDILRKEGPIDIYWDNVGGEILETALDNAKVNGRFLMCGAISGYNEPERPIMGLMNVVTQSLTMHGFIVFRLEERHPYLLQEFYEKVPSLITNGEIKYKEDVTRGLEKVGDVILDVQKGMNKGKAVILVAEC